MSGSLDDLLRFELPAGIEPRDYQAQAVASARACAARHGRPAIVAPTGAGKTTIAAIVAASAVSRDKRVLWVAHRRELLHQALERLRHFGLRCGLVLASSPEQRDDDAPVQVACIDTLRARKLRPPADVLVIDECHRVKARTYVELVEHYQAQGAAILGLTATPERADGKGLSPMFTDLIETTSTDALLADGILVPADVYAPNAPDLAGIKQHAGDFSATDASRRMAPLTGSVVEHWQRHAAGLRTLLFACTIDHSRSIVERFASAAIPAEHLDGSTPDAERDAILERLRSGETLIVSNVQVATEGLDIPNVSAIVLARPTRSVTVYLQAVGRGLRASPGKSKCIVLDHGGSALRLGHPQEPRRWRLDGRPKGEGLSERPRARCPECDRVKRPGEMLCACGRYTWPEQEIPTEAAGKLKRIERKAPRRSKEELKAHAAAYVEMLKEASLKGWKLKSAGVRFKQRFGYWPAYHRHLEDQHYRPSQAAIDRQAQRRTRWDRGTDRGARSDAK